MHGSAGVEDERMRRLACCASEPECVLCPLSPENAHRSLKELAEAGLRANLHLVAGGIGAGPDADAGA